MSEFPLGYERVPPTTWAYLSSLLMLAVYFKFNRVWSVRNLDLLLVILLAPGLLLVHFGATGRDAVRRSLLDTLAKAESKATEPEDSVGESASEAEPMDEAALDVGANVDDEAALSTPGFAPEAGAGGESKTEGAAAAEVPTVAPVISQSSEPVPVLAEEGEVPLDPRLDEVRRSEASRYFAARLKEHQGYLWLFLVGTVLLLRMLFDPMMVRRPLLEPNLSSGGLTFMGCAMLVFMLANVTTSQPTKLDLYYTPELVQTIGWPEAELAEPAGRLGPGYALLHKAPNLPTFVDTARTSSAANEPPTSRLTATVTCLTVMLSLLALVVGLMLVGYLHFENYWMGIGIAALFLMLPYTVQMIGRVSHVLPAALLIWAIVAYRWPLVAGAMIGAASGCVYYPLFLLPLWGSFYWRRGFARFVFGFLAASGGMVALLAYEAGSTSEWLEGLRSMFGLWLPRHNGLAGIWALGWEPVFRLPIIAASLAISGALAIWPSQKNLGSLLSGSCAVMISIQFWHGYGGGLSMAWYLPLALLCIFRPNLEDRVAILVLREGWRPGRAARIATPTGQAA